MSRLSFPFGKKAAERTTIWLVAGLICFFMSANAFGQNWTSLVTIGSSISITGDQGKSSCTDPNGNIFLAGNFTDVSGVDLQPGAGVTTFSSPSNSLQGIYVMKYNSAGVFQWVVQPAVGLNSINVGFSNAICSDGTYFYIVGGFRDSITVGSTKIYSSPANGTNVDLFVAKYNVSDGSAVWAAAYGSSNLETPVSMCLDASGNPYVSALFTTSTVIGGTTYTAVGGSGSDIMIMKLDPANGSVQWVNTGGASAQNDGGAATGGIAYATSTNKIVVATSYFSAAAVYGGTVTLTNAGTNDVAILEIDPATGAFTNGFSIGTAGVEVCGGACYDKATGDVFVSGCYENTPTSPGVTFQASNSGTSSQFVARYSTTTHSLKWVRSGLNSTSTGTNNLMRSVTTNHNGSVFAGGLYNGSNTFQGASAGPASAGSFDCILVRLNSATGSYEGALYFGGLQGELINSVTANEYGTWAFTGQTPSTVAWSINGSPMASAGNQDIMIGMRSVPLVSTSTPLVTGTSATLGGNAVSDGQVSITSRGVVYSSTVDTPMIGNGTNVLMGAGTGSFGQLSSGLTPGTTYYLRAYIANDSGTYYGGVKSFTIAAGSSNNVPVFVGGATTSLSVCGTTVTNIASLLHVNDTNAAQTLTWSVQSAPTNGTLTITSATASAGSADVTPGGTLTYQATAGYTGSDAFTVRVSDGTATADKVVNVTVNASPNPGVVSTTTDSFCHTAAATYSTTGSGGTWSSSNTAVATVTSGGIVFGASPGTAVISYTATSASCGTASATLPVYIRPLSDTGTVTPLTSSTICAGSTLTYTSTSTTAGLPRYDGVTYGGVWTSSNTSVATVNNATGVVTGVSAGTVTITFAATGCGTFRARRTLNVNGIPAITLGSNPSVATGTTTAGLTYSATAGSPDRYSIVWSPAATTAGFGNVTSASLPASPIAITVPGAATAATYTGTLTVANSSTGCTSTNNSIAVIVTGPSNNAPVYTLSSPLSLVMCHDASAINLRDSLHVSDADAAQTLTWSVDAAPGHGTLSVIGATASSGGTDITPGGTITYQPTAGYSGSDGFSIKVSDGISSSSMSFLVTVNAGPSIFGNSPIDVCSGTSFTITPSATETSTYTWGVSSNTGSVTGASGGSGTSIVQTLTNPSHATDGAVVYSVVPTSTVTGCTGNSANYTVNVRAMPLITNAASVSLCSGTALSLPVTTTTPCNFFNWEPVSNSGSVTGTTSGASSTISQTLTNPDNTAAAYVTYTVAGTSLYNCTSPTDTITVKVNPKPVLSSSASYSICSGTATSISLEASTPSTFTWQVTGTATGASDGSGATIVQTLTATSNFFNANTNYALTITSDTGGCVNNIFQNVTVDVQARPVSTSLPPAVICSGSTTSITLTASVSSTFEWTVSSNAGLVTGVDSGSGSSIAQALVNPSNSDAATVVYSVVPTSVAQSCVGTPFTVSQSINPKPELTTPSSISLCSGTLLNYPLTASTPSFYNYTPVSISGGITGSSSASGVTSLNQTLTNPGSVSSGNVTYRLVPTSQSGSCVGDTGTITVKVHPIPVGTFTPLRSQCSGIPTNIALMSSTPATKTWTVSANFSSITGASSGSGDTIKQTLVNPFPSTDGYLQYSIVLTSDSAGCVKDLIYLDDTVKPAVPISVTSSPSVIAGVTSGDLVYSVPVPSLDPLTYDIQFSAAAHTAGFADVSDSILPHSTFPPTPVSVVIPSSVPAAVYDATIRVKNASGCYTVPATAFTVTILNRIPTYTDTSVATLTVCKDASATDIISSLHVSDEDGGQTLTWSQQAAPAHGTLVVTGATSASGTTDITPSGTITYQPEAGYGGADSFSVKVSDGTDNSVRKFRVWVSDVSATVSQTNVSCHGNADGSAVLTGINGTAPYNYTWSGTTGVTATVTGLAAGSYTATITDANTCIGEKIVTISQPATLIADINTSTNVTCHGGSNGTATATVAGGTAPYTYSWTPAGGTLATGTGLSAGDYTVTVTDAHSCTATASVTITEPTLVTASISGTTTVCNNTGSRVYISSEAGVSVAYTINGGSNLDAVMDANGADTIATGNLTAAATYELVNVTVGGCTYPASGSVTVSVYPQATVNSISDQVLCNTANTNGVVFTGPVSGSTFAWTNNNTSIGLGASGSDSIGSFTATNTGSVAQTATITVTPTANGCEGTPLAFTITVKPTPSVDIVADQALCNGQTTTLVSFSGTVSGTVYDWANNNTTTGLATTGTGNIGAFAATNAGTATEVSSVIVTPTANGCTGAADTFDISVYPTPSVDVISNQVVCNGLSTTLVTFSGPVSGSAYSWTNNDASIGLASSGTGDIAAFIATNNSDVPVVATVSVTATANSCVSPVRTFTIRVNPTAVITPVADVVVCNDAATGDITFSASAAGFAGFAAGPSYTWANNNSTIGLATTGTGDIASFTAVNAGTDPVVATVVVTPTELGCVGLSDTFDITVNPTPVFTSTLTPSAICNNTLFNYTPTSATAGTTFSWNRAVVTGISNSAATGTDDPAEILTNTVTEPVDVVYTYTLSANGCSNAQDVTVAVNPTPIFTSTLTATPVCDSSLFSYDPLSATAGTTYSWSRAAVTGISNVASSGVDNPMEYLVNTTTDPVNVQYVYTLTANSCENVQAVTVTVYPKPLLSSTLAPAAICDSTVFAYTPTSLTTGTNYVWSRDVVTGINNPANADNTDPAEILDNTTTAPVAVTYVYTLTANGCTNTQNVVVTVNPTPVLTSTLTVSPICDSTLFSYVPTSATTGTVFTWSRDTMESILNPSATGTDNPMEYLINIAPYPVNVAYTYTLTANGCSHTQIVEMTVNPKPLLSTTLTPSSVCDSALFSYEPASLTSSATYSWIRGTVAGIANVAGAGVDNPAEVLYNTTADSVAVVYVYTLTAYGCSNTQAVQVYVKPTPKLSTTLSPAAICNSTVFNYPPASATVGTSFAWSRATVGSISNPAATGTDNPMENLLNTSVAPVDVPYVFSLAAAGCDNDQVVTVTVNPTPKLNSSTLAEVCSTAPFNYTPTSATAGTAYTWTRAIVPGISNIAGAGSGNVGEVLYNTTNTAKTVIYRYTLTANSCSNIQNVLVTVNPTPVVPAIAIHPSATLCSKSLFMNFGASIPAADSTNYTWTAQNAIVHAQGAGHTNAIISFPYAGTANVILTSAVNGYTCYTHDTFSVAVSTSESPNAEIYYVNEHFIYTDNTVDSYQWGYDDGSTLDSVMYTGQVDQNMYMPSPDFAANKYWVLTTKGGCMSKSYYNAPVGVTNINTGEVASMSLFPNPATENVYVEVKGGNGNGMVELVDLTGKLISRVELTGHKAVLSVANLSSGIYMVTTYSNGIKVATGKLVKE